MHSPDSIPPMPSESTPLGAAMALLLEMEDVIDEIPYVARGLPPAEFEELNRALLGSVLLVRQISELATLGETDSEHDLAQELLGEFSATLHRIEHLAMRPS